MATHEVLAPPTHGEGLERARAEMLQAAAELPGLADALRLQESLAQAAGLNEAVMLAYEPVSSSGDGFTLRPA